jgi:uncharacterized Zn finger protein (UPF0148 family)
MLISTERIRQVYTDVLASIPPDDDEVSAEAQALMDKCARIYPSENCGICQAPPTSIVVTTPCGHIFCKACLFVNFKAGRTVCPACQGDISAAPDLYDWLPEPRSEAEEKRRRDINAILDTITIPNPDTSNQTHQSCDLPPYFRKLVMLVYETKPQNIITDKAMTAKDLYGELTPELGRNCASKFAGCDFWKRVLYYRAGKMIDEGNTVPDDVLTATGQTRRAHFNQYANTIWAAVRLLGHGILVAPIGIRNYKAFASERDRLLKNTEHVEGIHAALTNDQHRSYFTEFDQAVEKLIDGLEKQSDSKVGTAMAEIMEKLRDAGVDVKGDKATETEMVSEAGGGKRAADDAGASESPTKKRKPAPVRKGKGKGEDKENAPGSTAKKPKGRRGKKNKPEEVIADCDEE